MLECGALLVMRTAPLFKGVLYSMLYRYGVGSLQLVQDMFRLTCKQPPSVHVPTNAPLAWVDGHNGTAQASVLAWRRVKAKGGTPFRIMSNMRKFGTGMFVVSSVTFLAGCKFSYDGLRRLQERRYAAWQGGKEGSYDSAGL